MSTKTRYAAAIVDVVGVSFVSTYPDNLHRLGRLVAEADAFGEPLVAVLKRNPANKFDTNAVEVHVPALGSLGMVGHVSKETAARLAPLMDADVPFRGSVAAVRVDPWHPDRPGVSVSIERIEVGS